MVKKAKEQDKYGVIYARYSTEKQKELSIDGQLRECNALAAKMGITIIGEYIDRAISGKADNRPDFQRLIADSAKRRFGYVITWKIDRFARNRYDSAMYKAKLKSNGVKMAYVADNIPDSPEGILIESMLEGMAEYFSVNLASNVKRGMKEKAMSGKFNGGKPPLGYKIVDGQYVIDDLTAPIVRDIFQWYIEDETYKRIAERVYEKYGYEMRHKAMWCIVDNIKYTGVFKFKKGTDEEVEVPGVIPAIISDETFREAEKRRERMRGRSNLGRGKHFYLLSGKLECGTCHSACWGIGSYRTYGEYHYYGCAGTYDKICKQPKLKADPLEDAVMHAIYENVLTSETVEQIVIKASEIQQAETRVENAEGEKELRAVQKSIDNIMQAIEQGITTKTTKTRLEALEKRQASLIMEIEKRRASAPIFAESGQIRAFLAAFCSGDIDDKDFRKRIFDVFVKKILLYPDHVVVILNLSGGGDDGYLSLTIPVNLEGQTSTLEYLKTCPGKR